MYTEHDVNTHDFLTQDTPDSVWLMHSISQPKSDDNVPLPCKSQPCAIILKERERIGMDSHDGIIQSLYALGMHIDLLAHSAKLVTPITDGLNDIVDDIRLYIRNLQQSKQRQQSIHQRFEEILARHHARELLEVDLDMSEDIPPFTPMIFENICLMVQEAVSNVIGYKVGAVRGKGMGLHNLQKRAQFVDGKTRITSMPEQGTQLTIDLSY